MARALTRLALVLCALSYAAQALAQSCPELDDPNAASEWPIDEEEPLLLERLEGRGWDENALVLTRIATRLQQETGPELRPFHKLAAFLYNVGASYRGTPETASLLRVNDVTPTSCAEGVCAWQVLNGQVQVPAGSAGVYDCAYKRRLASYVHMIVEVLTKLQQPHLHAAQQSLSRYDQQWTRLVTSGYSQYPWEVLINGALPQSDAWGPSKHQLIAGHPFAGVGVGNVGNQDGERAFAAAVVGVEALGYLRYVRDFRYHFGVALAATSPNLTWSHRGVGPTLHLAGVALGYGYGLRSDQQHTVYMIIDVTRSIDDGLLERLAGKAFERYARSRITR